MSKITSREEARPKMDAIIKNKYSRSRATDNTLLNKADRSAITSLIHNTPAAYLVPAETYKLLMDIIEDYELAKLVESRRGDLSEAVEVNIDDL